MSDKITRELKQSANKCDVQFKITVPGDEKTNMNEIINRAKDFFRWIANPNQTVMDFTPKPEAVTIEKALMRADKPTKRGKVFSVGITTETLSEAGQGDLYNLSQTGKAVKVFIQTIESEKPAKKSKNKKTEKTDPDFEVDDQTNADDHVEPSPEPVDTEGEDW